MERKRHRTERTVWWIAGAAALGLHVAIFLLMPPFEIRRADGGPASRMIIAAGRWAVPLCSADCPHGAAPYDTLDPPPVLTNGELLNYQLPGIYPRTLWRYLEPSAGTFQVTVGTGGDVEDAVLLESTDNGTNEALLDIAQRMQFELPDVSRYGYGLAARVRIEVRRAR